MSESNSIEFVLRSKVEGQEITPDTIGLSRFNEFNLGGAQKANIHLKLNRSGKTLLVGASQGYLREQVENRLYHKVLLHPLERFVRQEPLRRVHECVFGVLALESEPVDPRL